MKRKERLRIMERIFASKLCVFRSKSFSTVLFAEPARRRGNRIIFHNVKASRWKQLFCVHKYFVSLGSSKKESKIKHQKLLKSLSETLWITNEVAVRRTWKRDEKSKELQLTLIEQRPRKSNFLQQSFHNFPSLFPSSQGKLINTEELRNRK